MQATSFFADTKRLATKGHRTWLIYRDRRGCDQRALYGMVEISKSALKELLDRPKEDGFFVGFLFGLGIGALLMLLALHFFDQLKF